jgi:hypothetical protein
MKDLLELVTSFQVPVRIYDTSCNTSYTDSIEPTIKNRVTEEYVRELIIFFNAKLRQDNIGIGQTNQRNQRKSKTRKSKKNKSKIRKSKTRKSKK